MQDTSALTVENKSICRRYKDRGRHIKAKEDNSLHKEAVLRELGVSQRGGEAGTAPREHQPEVTPVAKHSHMRCRLIRQTNLVAKLKFEIW